MRPGNLQSAAGKIQDSLQKLELSWTRTRESWDDANAATFEENVLNRIASEISAALPAIGLMSQTLGAASRECEE